MKETIVLNDTLCEHIADLAKLNIKNSEKETILKDMNDIVSFVSRLCEAPCAQDDATVSISKTGAMREDIPQKSLSRDKIIAASSSSQEGYITVPKVIEA